MTVTIYGALGFEGSARALVRAISPARGFDTSNQLEADDLQFSDYGVTIGYDDGAPHRVFVPWSNIASIDSAI